MDNTSCLKETEFSKELVYQQLPKIFCDPFFSNSDILRKFLTYIVDQTLSGHAGWLKEYTIGVNVLQKSVDFKPQDNGIVRIHAGRLRRALRHYYDSVGALDSVCISVPKGGYIPVFSMNGSQVQGFELSNKNPVKQDHEDKSKKPLAIAVIPFQHFQNNSIENSLVEGLCLQLSNELANCSKLSVIAYFTVKDLWKKTNDISRIVSVVAAKYVFAGSIQLCEGRVRSHIELIDTETNLQIWSCMYEGEFTAEDIFNVQDNIVKAITVTPVWLSKLPENKPHQRRLVAVA